MTSLRKQKKVQKHTDKAYFDKWDDDGGDGMESSNELSSVLRVIKGRACGDEWISILKSKLIYN